MFKEIWEKKAMMIFILAEQDVAYEIPPLPLYVQVAFQHYIGIYFPEIRDFFSRYALHPNKKEDFWVEYAGEEIQTTSIISNLIMSRFRNLQQPPTLTVHFRRKEKVLPINLAQYYNQALKASTYLKDKKKGLSILLSDFSKQQLNNLFVKFKQNNFDEFWGTPTIKTPQTPNTPTSQQQSQNDLISGFKHLMITVQCMPIKIITQQEKIERVGDLDCTLSQLKINIFGKIRSQQMPLFELFCIQVPDGTRLGELKSFCHPQGFLYLYVHI